MKSLSLVQLLATPWTAAYQPPPSMGFSRQEYWSGLPLPSPSQHLYSFVNCVFCFIYLYGRHLIHLCALRSNTKLEFNEVLFVYEKLLTICKNTINFLPTIQRMGWLNIYLALLVLKSYFLRWRETGKF